MGYLSFTFLVAPCRDCSMIFIVFIRGAAWVPVLAGNIRATLFKRRYDDNGLFIINFYGGFLPLPRIGSRILLIIPSFIWTYIPISFIFLPLLN